LAHLKSTILPERKFLDNLKTYIVLNIKWE